MILPIAPGSSLLVRGAAESILLLHIGGGSVGILSGFVALLSRKGGRLHRRAGNIFFGSMLIMAAIGATVSPFLHDRVSTVAGILTFYLVLTGWLTVRRRENSIGRFEHGAFVAVLGVVAANLTLALMARNSPTGTLDGAPPQAFYVIGSMATIAAGSDLKVILRGGISGVQRIARHLWRLSAALIIAVTSLFLGQPQLFPVPLRGSLLLFMPTFMVLALMFFWLLRIRLAGRFRKTAMAV